MHPREHAALSCGRLPARVANPAGGAPGARASRSTNPAGGAPGARAPRCTKPTGRTRGARIEKSCAMRTSASYTELSPCGWYLPSTSPTTRALFLIRQHFQ